MQLRKFLVSKIIFEKVTAEGPKEHGLPGLAVGCEKIWKGATGRRRADPSPAQARRPSPGRTSDSELDESELDDDESEGVANHD
jgi:hypothetical protein